MRYIIKWILSAFLAVVVPALTGCGLKPSPGIPADITIPRLLAAVEKQSSRMKDFSGKAFVKAKIKGESVKTAWITMRYVQPDNFRVFIKGFAGIEIARIYALSDSIVLYFPTENAYITIESRDESCKTGVSEFLQLFIPDVDLDVERIIKIFSSPIPPREQQHRYEMSLQHSGREAVLTLKKGANSYSYTFKGPEMLMVNEHISCDGVTVWNKTASGFRKIDGIPFPKILTIESSGSDLHIEFSDCSINSGLTANDISFKIPSSAERIYVDTTWSE